MADDLRVLKSHKTPSPNEGASPAHLVPGKVLRLHQVKTGRKIKILSVQLSQPSRGNLYAQGFIENRKATVIHNDYRGRIMLSLEGDIYLLGRLETHRIQVRELIPES